MLARIRASRAYGRTRKRLGRYGRRYRFFQRAGSLVPYLGVEADGVTYFVSTRDRNIARSLFVSRGRRKEHAHLDRALHILDSTGAGLRRGVILDIGANIGTTVVPALVDHGFDAAVAVEPEPRNFQLLRTNLAFNGLEERVRAYQVALSDAPGEAMLDVTSTNSGRYHLTTQERPGRSTTRVTCARLDDLLAEAAVRPESVDLVWMDVEGHEPFVLAGAPSLLARSVPLVLEFNPGHLARADGLGLLVEQLSGSYTHVYDLHRPADEPLPTAQLNELAERYAASFTDLLACRVEA